MIGCKRLGDGGGARKRNGMRSRKGGGGGNGEFRRRGDLKWRWD